MAQPAAPPTLMQARAACDEARATASEAIHAIVGPARAQMQQAMADARDWKTEVPRPVITAYLTAWDEAAEVSRAILDGPEADVREALGIRKQVDDE